MTRLVSKMIPISSVVTRITLERTTNKTGQPYSLYSFEAISELSPEEAESARNCSKRFMEFVAAADSEEKAVG